MNRPGTHNSQSVADEALEYLPGAQEMQEVWPLEDTKEPALQLEQKDRPICPTTELTLPAEQLEHVD